MILIYIKHTTVFLNFLWYIFCVLSQFVCPSPRSLKTENERIEVPVLKSIVQCAFEGLEHFNPVHGLLPFELRKKLCLWVV